jgi:hypothetical protein
MELHENELIVLEGLVSNKEEWALLKKMFRWQIEKFWNALRNTDIADESRVAANHKLAVGVEASLNEFVKEMEFAHNGRTFKQPEVMPDVTKELLGS